MFKILLFVKYVIFYVVFCKKWNIIVYVGEMGGGCYIKKKILWIRKEINDFVVM